MKRTILFAIVLLISINKTFAASGGPDAFGYLWKDSNEPGGPVYNWIDITTLPNTVLVTGLSDDNNTGPYPVGFNFQYYWYGVSQFWVGSNGYIGFTNGQISSPFPVIPGAAQPQNFIAAFAADLNFDGASNPGDVYYWQNAANDTLIVSYENVPFWSNSAPNGYITGSNSFQIILSNSDSSITFQYKAQNGSSAATTQFLSIGIENNAGSVGLQHSYGQYPPVNYAVKYYYPSSTSYQVIDAAVMWNNNEETGAKFLMNNSGAFPLSSSVKNTGNQNLNPFNVNAQVTNASGGVVVSGSAAVTIPNPGDEQVITQTNSFSPVSTGTYSFKSETMLSNDATPSNNAKTMELVVIDTNNVLVNLQYCDDSSEGVGLSWQGGNGGVGVYFEPPFHPFVIQRLEYFIMADPQAVGFTTKVNANDGINNAPGTELVNINVPSTSIVTGGWNQVLLSQPLTVSDTGVYVSWIMNGDGISIGQDQTLPYSNQTYEVLGAGWAINRYRELEDVMIRMVVSTPTGALTQLKSYYKSTALDIYPVPFNDQINLNLTNQSQQVTIMNASGELVYTASTLGKNKMTIDASLWPSGLYLVQVVEENNMVTKKLIKQ